MATATEVVTIRRLTWIGLCFNAFFGLSKLYLGILGHSPALIADSIHSWVDLLMDGFILITGFYSQKAADSDHPYGHGRIETLATVALSLILLATALGIALDAVNHLNHPTAYPPTLAMGLVTLASILGHEWLYRRMHHLATRTHSPLLRANAWHHRSDAAASLIVLLGLLGSFADQPYLDPLAALWVAFLITKMAVGLIWHASKELIDTAVDPVLRTQFEQTILSIPGVVRLHQLRTRCLAGRVFIDVHIQVEPKLTVSEGHAIGHAVHRRFLEQFKQVDDVTVHIDPENDENTENPERTLPLPAHLHASLKSIWVKLPLSDRIATVRAHYMDGRIDLDIYLRFPPDLTLTALQALQNCYQLHLKTCPYIREVTLFYFAKSDKLN